MAVAYESKKADVASDMSDHALYLDLLKRCLTGIIYPESSNQELHPNRPGKRWAVSFLRKRGYKLLKIVPFDPAARELGKDWPSIGYSMVGLKRLDNLQFCIETALNEGVPGDLLEAGVWRGGSCILARAILKLRGVRDRNVWLADSFEGMPVPLLEADQNHDFSDVSVLAVSQGEVEAAFERFGLLDNQVKFLKGWFKDTLPNAPVSKLAVLRMDGDLYESSMDILNSLYHKVSAGGFVIVDDYYDWAPCREAIHDFRDRVGIKDEIQRIDSNGAFWRKSA